MTTVTERSWLLQEDTCRMAPVLCCLQVSFGLVYDIALVDLPLL
jgi:hypothetical protein